MHQKAVDYARDHTTQALEGLQELLRIPSVSTLPEHKGDMQQAARWLADKFGQIGLQNQQIVPTASHPIVYADWLNAGPDAPTLLIYGHYDVQPVDPLEEWQTSPFEPAIKGEDIFARGANDNKGQFYTHIMAVEAYLRSSGQLPVNIKFMLEGEEELGSPHLDQFVKEHQDLLEADAAAISDTSILDPDTPALITGVRGLVYMELSLRGSRRDLHSGSYGGVVQNPLNAMARVLAALHDDQGRVTIPDFYDAVRQLSAAERDALNNGAITEERVLAQTGAPALWGEAGYTVAERVGARPTLDVHGIKGGFIGAGQKTVIPAVATAKVSMRLVPDQNPDEIARLFTDYIHQISPATMEVSVQRLASSGGAVVDLSAPPVEAAAKAYELGFGRRPIFIREGGTLPIVATLSQVLETPVVLMGYGLPDDGLHAPNEKFHLPNFYRGIETNVHFYHILSEKSNS